MQNNDKSKKTVLIDLTANSPSPVNGSKSTNPPACIRSSSIQPAPPQHHQQPKTTASSNPSSSVPPTPAAVRSPAMKNPYSTSKKVSTPMVNPYAKKPAKSFVGGAEQARLNARKRQGKKIAVPKPSNVSEVVSRHMNPVDRFFMIMLMTTAAEYMKAATKDSVAQEIWEACCRRAGVPLCKNPIAPVYSTASEHYSIRTALMLEEARHSISVGMETSWSRRKQPLHMLCLVQERNRQGFIKATFRKNLKFTKDELFSIRPGSVVQCMMRDDQPIVKNAYLGVITSANRESTEKERSFSVSFFVDNMPDTTKMDVSIMFITQLVTECRCFEALTTMPNLAFTKQLLGAPESQVKGVHTRFKDDGTATVNSKEEPGKTLDDFFKAKPVKEEESKIFSFKKLNKTQEDAAYSFLNSASGTISIVQGPPGTGMQTSDAFANY